MTAIPVTLEDALRLSGYTIDVQQRAASVITTPDGDIAIPDMLTSALTWHGDGTPTAGAALYLDRLTPFHPDYADVLTSHVLDRYRTRRLAYDTLDEFALAVRRWNNLHLGPFSTINRRYLTAATDLPLTDLDITRHTDSSSELEAADTATSSDTSTSSAKSRDAQSDYPQGQLADNLDYANGVNDQVSEGTVAGTGETEANRTATEQATTTQTETGRSSHTLMQLIEQQRATLINADEELLDAMEDLFLGVYDRSEADRYTAHPYSGMKGW